MTATTQARAWGTPAAPPAPRGQDAPTEPPRGAGGLTEYLVIGGYRLTGERFGTHVWAQNPRAAEDMVTAEEAPKHLGGQPSGFFVAGVAVVVDGRAVLVDTYAKFFDPDA